jgi:hypothetical protein
MAKALGAVRLRSGGKCASRRAELATGRIILARRRNAPLAAAVGHDHSVGIRGVRPAARGLPFSFAECRSPAGNLKRLGLRRVEGDASVGNRTLLRQLGD